MKKNPNFTKKHYQAVARLLSIRLNTLKADYGNLPPATIHDHEIQGRKAEIMVLAENFAHHFGCDNPRFDRDLFLAVVRGEKPVTARPARKGV